MTIAPRLFELYRRRGFSVVSGLNPAFWSGMFEASFTALLKDGANWTNGLGIALQEVYFLETLFAAYRPRRVLVVGNSFGWSSLVIALANPDAQIVALDAGFDKNSLAGIDLTNSIAAEAGLRVRAVKGVSPQDVPEAARAFDGPIDFAFIDGLHTNEQIVLDWRAARAAGAADTVYLFHDVTAVKLEAGIARIKAEAGGELEVVGLAATTSGMVIAYPHALASVLAPTLLVFAPEPHVLASMRRVAWRRTHPVRARWHRSLIKRANKVRKSLGRPIVPVP